MRFEVEANVILGLASRRVVDVLVRGLVGAFSGSVVVESGRYIMGR